MLVTTCPECETTFRLSEEILHKAGGQVRCGRCAHIFDAKTALREQAETEIRRIESPAPEAAERSDASARKPSETDAGTASESSQSGTDSTREADTVVESKREASPGFGRIPRSPPSPATRTPEATGPERPAAPDDDSASSDETGPEPDEETGPTEDEPKAATDAKENAAAATADLAGEGAVDDALPVPDWLPAARAREERRTWPWAVGAALLTLLLAGQLVHFFRADLAGLPTIGPLLGRAYSRLGIDLVPRVDLRQYEMLDLTGAAESVTDEQGSLVIEARVRNKGPRVQAFPHIFVRLLDRWQDTIAGRYFGPAEYLVTPASDTSRMSVGKTVDVELVIIDPGPSATGFELEFCVPAGDGYHCESDEAQE